MRLLLEGATISAPLFKAGPLHLPDYCQGWGLLNTRAVLHNTFDVEVLSRQNFAHLPRGPGLAIAPAIALRIESGGDLLRCASLSVQIKNCLYDGDFRGDDLDRAVTAGIPVG